MVKSVSLLASSLYIGPFASYMLAAARCTVNGKEIACGEFGKFVGIIAGLGLAATLIILIVGILAFIFWIMMLIDIIKRDVEYKPVWILIILLTGVVGAAVYYFAIKRNAQK